MADNNFLKRRSRTTFATSLVIISLVLLVLGVFAFLALYVNVYLEDQQAKIPMIVVMPKDATPAEQDSLRTVFTNQEFAQEVTLKTQEEAKEEFIGQVGEDFSKIMGDANPMHPVLEVQLNPEYITSERIERIQRDFTRVNSLVEEVDYPIKDLEEIKKNVFLITVASLAVVLLLMFIAFFIIRSTIRLAVYSKRLIIRSMQLIGATSGFIRRPFLGMGLLQGVLGALLANAILTGIIFAVGESKIFGEMEHVIKSPEYMILLVGIVIFGALLGLMSSGNAVNKFLGKNLDELM